MDIQPQAGADLQVRGEDDTTSWFCRYLRTDVFDGLFYVAWYEIVHYVRGRQMFLFQPTWTDPVDPRTVINITYLKKVKFTALNQILFMTLEDWETLSDEARSQEKLIEYVTPVIVLD